MGRSRKPRLPSEPIEASIESLSHDGRGVARIEGKTMFIDGALPGERVLAKLVERHRKYDEAAVTEVLLASPQRVEPKCPHAGVCGGCSLQHMEAQAQIDAKQQVLLGNLKHIGKVEPAEILPPLRGPHWGYRTKARLGAKYVRKKGRMLVGFREKHSGRLTTGLR